MKKLRNGMTIYSITVVLVLLLVSSASAVPEGMWSGTTDQGYRISFVVNSSELKDIYIKVYFAVAKYGTEIFYEDTVIQGDDTFEYKFDWDIGWEEKAIIAGKFIDDTTYTGTWSVSLDGDTAGGTWEVGPDTDSDGVPDDKDPFPNDPTEWRDTDGDGIGNNADPDDDNDGMPDEWEELYGLNPLVNDALDDLDGDTVSNLDEYEEGTDPDNLPVEAFVIRFYQLCLDRNADGAGLTGWVDGLLDGSLTGSDVAYGFVFSSEFLEKNTTDEEYLDILYQAFFNRDPDPAGWEGWLSVLEGGTGREHVLKGFIYAREFNELCRDYGIIPNPVAAFVTRFYQLCLKRDPDIAGLDGWVASLLSGENVGADVADGFIFSPEFTKTIITHEEYMEILYKAFFNRDPDEAGLSGWLDELNSGTSRADVLDGFIYSKEFAQLCEDYGITPY